ncbi:hypothetical protein LOK49_LG15G02150 [Camellia lanceoleosa]|uniref:Uncharacterized protein n=1 Tax=Camellia lanceoleosa TaxID=1840588 RepID=A0ACC0FB05_9ERIC|nr:hypothetical protein LOK49_LG15G02150 [Camellia lanceoleosa]
MPGSCISKQSIIHRTNQLRTGYVYTCNLCPKAYNQKY